jgi:hypothetical protein
VISKFKQQKKACLQAKDGSGKTYLAFLFEEITAIKRQMKPEKTASSMKRNDEYILSAEISLTTSSDNSLLNLT